MSPPPPSVSPLSNARTSVEVSPSANKMSAQATSDLAHSHSRTRHLLDDDDDDDDDKSSSLSEPDDDIADEEEGEDEDRDVEEEDEEDDDVGDGDIDEAEEEDHFQRHGKPSAFRARPRIEQSEDIDSEAETERLDQTPRKLRDGANSLGRTPSKLTAVEHADDELSDAPSPIPHDDGAASSTSTTTGKKRKRSDALESPFTSEESINGETKRQKSEQLNDDDDAADEEVSNVTSTSKSTKGKRGKQKRGAAQSKLAAEAVESVEPSDAVEENEVEDTVEAQTEDDPVRKSEATDAFVLLAKQFTAFRDTLYNERIASIDAELALLEQPKCQHPEYLRMVACVEQRRLKQDRETRAYHHYKQVAIRQRTLGERAQLHSQYFQSVREVREQALDELGAEWYAIHRERRQGVTNRPDDSTALYQYVDQRSDHLRQQAKYNLEVSILSGFAKYVGFPAAPDISGVAGDALDADLKAMKLARRAPQTAAGHTNHQHHTHQHHNHSHTPYVPRQNDQTAASSERIAHEQFIEQHAWARAPQYTNHHTPLASTPNISHTPEWAEHTTGFRKPSNGMGRHNDDVANQASRFATPTSSRVQREDPINHEREGTQAGQRVGLIGSSPLQVSKQRLNAASDKDAWRNYSGTSTIDAPLGESNRESDAADGDPGSSSRADAPPHAAEHSLPRLSESVNQGAGASAAVFGADRPDVFRTTGFRPLDGGFPAATAGSVPSRT